MKMTVVARRYAVALQELTAGESEAVKERVLGAMTLVNQLFSHPDAKVVLASPAMPVDLKEQLLHFAAKQAPTATGASADLPQFFLDFLSYLVQARRASLFPEILAAYRTETLRQQGICQGVLVTARPISADLRATIQTRCSEIFGSQVELQGRVDPEILGGFCVQVGHKQIDLSVRAKLSAIGELAALTKTASLGNG